MEGRGIKFKGVVQRMNPTRFCGGIPAHKKYGFCNTERNGKLRDHTYTDRQRNYAGAIHNLNLPARLQFMDD